MRLSLLIVLGLASQAAADPCKGAEPTVRSVVRKIQGLASRASEASVTCGFHGARPELVDKLHEQGKRVASDEQAVIKWETCKVSPSGLTVVGLVTNYDTWAGEAFTAALDVCGPKQGVAAVAPSSNAECKAGEAWLLAWVQKMEQTAAKASEAAVTCAFKGANDKLLTDLARVMKPQIQKVIKAAPKKLCKSDVFSSQKVAEVAAESAGKRLGFAVAMCSSKARKKLAELVRAGKMTSEEAGKALGPMTESFMESVFGDLGP